MKIITLYAIKYKKINKLTVFVIKVTILIYFNKYSSKAFLTPTAKGGLVAIKRLLLEIKWPIKWNCEDLLLRRTGTGGWNRKLSGSCHCLRETARGCTGLPHFSKTFLSMCALSLKVHSDVATRFTSNHPFIQPSGHPSIHLAIQATVKW